MISQNPRVSFSPPLASQASSAIPGFFHGCSKSNPRSSCSCSKPSLQLLTLYFKLSDNKIYLICLGKQFLTDWIIPKQETICNQFKSSKDNVPREIPAGLCACFPIMGNTVHTSMPSGHGKSSDKTCRGRCLPKTWYVGSGPPSSRSRFSDILQQHQRREVYSTPWAELSPVGRDQLWVTPCIKRKRLPKNWTCLCPSSQLYEDKFPWRFLRTTSPGRSQFSVW